MELELIANGILKAGRKYLDMRRTEEMVDEIYRSILQVYYHQSEVHFKAAIESMKALLMSGRPEAELRSAIHHLYDAYFSLFTLLDKTRTRKAFLLTRSEDIVKYKEDIYVPCLKIASMIHELYGFLGEKKNAGQWHEYKEDLYHKARQIYLDFLSYKGNRIADPEEALKPSRFFTIQDDLDQTVWRRRFEQQHLFEISQEQYESLKRFSPGYVQCRELPGITPRVGFHNAIYAQRHTFYLLTDKGLKYINDRLDELEIIYRDGPGLCTSETAGS